MNYFIGDIDMFKTQPNGWLPCNGQNLLIFLYPDLFNSISNDYGGDGITTFSLPDMSTEAPYGYMYYILCAHV